MFHRFDFGERWKFMPSLGVHHEHSGKDAHRSDAVACSRNCTLFTHVGSRVWWRSWAVTANFHYAVACNFGALMVPNRERIVVGMTYNLIKKPRNT